MPAYSKTGKFGVKAEQSYMDDRDPVENEKGSGARSCKCCDSWLAHWENNARTSRRECVYMGCRAKPAHGAHVKYIDIDKGRKLPKSWIIPLCEKHNNPGHKNPFYIDKTVELVPEGSGSKCFRSSKQATKDSNFYMRVVRRKITLKCDCATLSDHYQVNSKSKRRRCVVTPCGKQTREFGVLQSADKRTDSNLWIAPVCRTHKKWPEPFYLENAAWLVPFKPGRNCP